MMHSDLMKLAGKRLRHISILKEDNAQRTNNGDISMIISPTKRLVNKMEDDVFALKDASDTLYLFVQGVVAEHDMVSLPR